MLTMNYHYHRGTANRTVSMMSSGANKVSSRYMGHKDENAADII